MATSDKEPAAPRKEYREPRLTDYGALKDLTTGGTGTAQESSQGKRPRP